MSNEIYYLPVLSCFFLCSDSQWPNASAWGIAKSFKNILEPFSNVFMAQVFFLSVCMTQMLAYLLTGLRLTSFSGIEMPTCCYHCEADGKPKSNSCCVGSQLLTYFVIQYSVSESRLTRFIFRSKGTNPHV